MLAKHPIRVEALPGVTWDKPTPPHLPTYSGPVAKAADRDRPDNAVRHASVADAPEVARLLHDFNTEFSEPGPEVSELADRIAQFIERDDATSCSPEAGRTASRRFASAPRS